MTVAFSDQAYKDFDQLGKEAVIKHFVKNGFNHHSENENRGIDLRFSKDGFPDIYAEVAVRYRFNWLLSEWEKHSPWDTIHILLRKRKYGKPEPEWYGDKAYLFELNRDATEAFVIRPCELQRKHLKNIMTTRGLYEPMYDVPVKYFQLVKLLR